MSGLVFGLGAAEIALQFSPISFRSYPRYQSDMHFGMRLRPDQQGWQTKEGRAFVEVNRDGFRDREHSLAKPAKTFRIAVVGDSYAEAAQVAIDQTFWSVLGDELQSCLPDTYDDVEVLNFGVSGYGTAQELLVLRHDVWRFDPDLVLLAFLPSNDIRNNSKELEPDQQRPFFVIEDRRLILDNSFRENAEWRRLHNSPWIQFKDWTIRHFELAALLYRLRHADEQPQAPQGQREIEAGLSAQIFYPPRDESWKDAWEITERLIVQMQKEVAERGIPFTVLSVTSGVVVRPEEEPREELREDLGVADLFYPDRWIEQLGEKHGFSVVTLSEPMQEHAVAEHVYFHGFENTEWGTGHWNAKGHAFAGERAAAVICEQLLRPPSE